MNKNISISIGLCIISSFSTWYLLNKYIVRKSTTQTNSTQTDHKDHIDKFIQTDIEYEKIDDPYSSYDIITFTEKF